MPDRQPAQERRAAQVRDRVDRGPHRGEPAHQPNPRPRRRVAPRRLCRLHAPTERLLRYWTDPDRERKLFFCQIEALETAIYLTEVAKQVRRRLDRERAARRPTTTSNPGLPRMAFKMATGTGKTVVMAMLIAWQTLNKLANPQDARFTDAFLSSRPASRSATGCACCCRPTRTTTTAQRDIVPARPARAPRPGQDRHHQLPRLPAARDRSTAGEADEGDPRRRATPSPFTETPDQMVRRVCRELGTKKQHRRPQRRGPPLLPAQARRATDEKLTGDDRNEAKKRDEEARVWISGLEAVQAQDRRQGGLRPVGHAVLPPGLRLPGGHALPVGGLRLLADRRHRVRHRQGAARAGRRQRDDRRPADLPRPVAAHPRRPAEEGPQDRLPSAASRSCPPNCKGRCTASTATTSSRSACGSRTPTRSARGQTPPVFIVVCNNTNVSKLVFDYIAGWEKHAARRQRPSSVPGKLAALPQRRRQRRWSAPAEHDPRRLASSSSPARR